MKTKYDLTQAAEAIKAYATDKPEEAALIAESPVMYEELKRLKELNAEMLEALKIALHFIYNPAQAEEEAREATAGNLDANEVAAHYIETAIAKVEGREV